MTNRLSAQCGWKAILVVLAAWCLLLGDLQAADPAARRQAVPPLAARQAAVKTVRDIYKDDLAKAVGGRQTSAVAGAMIKAAGETAGDPAGQFALLQVAADVAADTGNAELAMSAIDAIAAQFEIDELSVKSHEFTRLLEKVPAAEQPRLLTLADELIQRAMAAEQYALAEALNTQAQTVAQKINHASALKKLLEQADEIRTLSKNRAEVDAAIKKLATDPNDPAANLVVGRFLCYEKGDFDHGLNDLSHSSDPKLQELARLELAKPSAGAEQMEIANRWWALAEAEKSPVKDRLRLHAAEWYRLHRADASGITKDLIAKRLAEVAKIDAAKFGAGVSQATAKSKKSSEKYALLVGVHQYDKNELRSLPYTEADMTGLADVLLQSGYSQENIVLMTQTRGAQRASDLPMAANIRKQLKLLLDNCGEGDSVLIALAGHGVQFKNSDEAFFCPMDAKLKDKQTLISFKELYGDLEKCKADFKLVLADACRNDPQSDNSRSRAEVDLESVTRPQKTPPPGGVAVFFSCSPTERAFEHENLKHGIFFNFVIEGLKGKAAAAGSSEVTLNDLDSYVTQHVKDFVRSEYQERQVPEMVSKVRDLPVLVSLSREETASAVATSRPQPSVASGVVTVGNGNTAEGVSSPPPLTGVERNSRLKSPFATVRISSDGKFVPLQLNATMTTDEGHIRLTKVPPEFAGLQLLKCSKFQATLKFEVMSPGTVIVALLVKDKPKNKGRGGELEKEFVTPKDLLAQGWREFGKLEAINPKDPEQVGWVAYSRDCKKNESFSYRTEKYLAPAIFLNASAAKASQVVPEKVEKHPASKKAS